MIDAPFVAGVLGSARSLGRLAVQAPGAEGTWSVLKVDGTIPEGLNGDLYRVAPGQKTNHGVELRHYFDGDAFLVKYRLRERKATVSARFVATPERQDETATGRMLYSEFGTLAPAPAKGRKNQPSINVIRWDGRLLALSEGGHPSAIDPDTLTFQEHWDFHGTLPTDVTFTAHPKIDLATGAGYAFGTHRGRDLSLVAFRMELDGTLTQIAAIPQPNFFMVHDMLLGSEHLVFVVPPVHYDLEALWSGRVAAADSLRYMASEPTRLIVVRKDGKGSPITFEQPACMVFHHGNLAETGDSITFDSLMSPDDSILRYIYEWSAEKPTRPRPTQLTRLSLDLTRRQVTGRTVLGEGLEYPRFDSRMSGEAARHLYTLADEQDFAMRALVRYDFDTGTTLRVEARQGHALEEAVFVPRPGKIAEGDGWLLHQGYSADRDETYLDIRDASTLELAARVWTGQHLPIGLHGNFYPQT
jgi:carotenoid cleavage dioxygenase-like enzyme